MVRCPVCKRITRFNGEKCLECGYCYSEDDKNKLTHKETEYKGKMRLREKLRDVAFWCDMIGTLLLVLALTLTGPAFIRIFGYLRARKRVGAAHLSKDASSILIWGVVLSCLVVICIIASIILFYVKRRSSKKIKKLRNVL